MPCTEPNNLVHTHGVLAGKCSYVHGKLFGKSTVVNPSLIDRTMQLFTYTRMYILTTLTKGFSKMNVCSYISHSELRLIGDDVFFICANFL